MSAGLIEKQDEVERIVQSLVSEREDLIRRYGELTPLFAQAGGKYLVQIRLSKVKTFSLWSGREVKSSSRLHELGYPVDGIYVINFQQILTNYFTHARADPPVGEVAPFYMLAVINGIAPHDGNAADLLKGVLVGNTDLSYEANPEVEIELVWSD